MGKHIDLRNACAEDRDDHGTHISVLFAMQRQIRPTRLAAFSLMFLLLMASACGDAPSSRQAAMENTATDEDTPPDADVGMCRFLSEAEAEAALGYPVTVTSTSAYGSIEECEFKPAGGEQYGDGTLFVRVNEPMDPAASFAETRELGDVEDIDGVGDQAFLYATELWVLADSHEVVVRVDWYGDQMMKVRETSVNLAKTVLSHL